MSKIFIIGANGKIGKNLVNVLTETNEHDVTAGLRNKEQFSFFEDKGVKPAYLNLEDDVDTIADTLSGADVVVFTAGSGGKTGADKTIMIDLDGAAKSVKAAEKVGVQQFIMVSTMHADEPEYWTEEGMKPYFIAKHYADRIIKESSLNFTILRPGVLSDKDGTGNVTTNPAGYESSRIPREDVAYVIKTTIDNKAAYGKIVTLLEGNSPISEIYN